VVVLGISGNVVLGLLFRIISGIRPAWSGQRQDQQQDGLSLEVDASVFSNITGIAAL
jgi:hypothetical protein